MRVGCRRVRLRRQVPRTAAKEGAFEPRPIMYNHPTLLQSFASGELLQVIVPILAVMTAVVDSSILKCDHSLGIRMILNLECRRDDRHTATVP